MIHLFKFNSNGVDPTDLQSGQFVDGYKSIQWTERYRDAGEVIIEGALSSGLDRLLPIGTLVSHIHSYEVMIIESHNVVEHADEDPTIRISGRSLETALENRVVGLNLARSTNDLGDYTLAAANSWAQAVTLINQHITTAGGANAADILGSLSAFTSLTTGGTSEERKFGRVPLYPTLLSILAVDNCGIRTIRKNVAGFNSTTATTFMIHKGTDRSGAIVYSSKAGDIESAEYLWSQKSYMNAAIVVSRYLQQLCLPSQTAWNRRFMIVNANDLDSHLDVVPTGATRTNLLNAMTTRGWQAIRNQTRVDLVRADLSELSRYKFRKDFHVGDIVSLDVSFGPIAKRRIVEYTEILDENEFREYPTFELPEPED